VIQPNHQVLNIYIILTSFKSNHHDKIGQPSLIPVHSVKNLNFMIHVSVSLNTTELLQQKFEIWSHRVP